MTSEKGPNIKKKQKCKNWLAQEGRQGREVPALQGHGAAVMVSR